MSNARFSILQARAVKDKRISDSQFRTLAALGMYADENGWCFPKLSTLGGDLGKSKQAVGKDTIALRKLGYLEVSPRYREDGSRTSSEYRLIFDTPRQHRVDTPSTPEVDTPSTPEVDALNDPIKRPNLTEKAKKEILSKSDIAWSLIGDNKIEQEQIDEKVLEKDALDTFERDLQLPANWSWYGKGSEDKSLADLRKFVIELYSKDKKCFQTYQTWRTQPYARGAMSNLAIKRNPENFRASWTDFLASNAMYGKQKPNEPTVDANGIPVSY